MKGWLSFKNAAGRVTTIRTDRIDGVDVADADGKIRITMASGAAYYAPASMSEKLGEAMNMAIAEPPHRAAPHVYNAASDATDLLQAIAEDDIGRARELADYIRRRSQEPVHTL